jgi:ribosomal protein L19E
LTFVGNIELDKMIEEEQVIKKQKNQISAFALLSSSIAKQKSRKKRKGPHL